MAKVVKTSGHIAHDLTVFDNPDLKWRVFRLFAEHVDNSGGQDACWPWMRSCSDRGYGGFRALGKWYLVPRVVYHVFCGDIPPGHLIRHKCDNPSCCNPLHLETGTSKDNARDAVDRGRLPTLLSESAVREIRRLRNRGVPIRVVARQFKCSMATISYIHSKKRRQHVA